MGTALFSLAIMAALLSTLGYSVISPIGNNHRVQTSSGLIVGHPAPNRTQVAEFLGIPFAQPPGGDLRFASPQAFRAPKKVIQASKFVSHLSHIHDGVSTKD